MNLSQFVIRENDPSELAIEKYRKLFDHAAIITGTKGYVINELRESVESYSQLIGPSVKEYAKFEAGTARTRIATGLKRIFVDISVSDSFLEPVIDDLPRQPTEQRSLLLKKREVSNLDYLLETLNQLPKGQPYDENHSYLTEKFRMAFLIQLFGCINDGGLHPLIGQRTAEFKRYNVLLDLGSRQRNRLEMMRLQPLHRVQNDFVKAFLQQKNFVINGQVIPFKQVRQLLITETPLRDEEITYFENKHQVEGIENFIRICADVTNELLHNPFVQNDNGSATIWSFLHPKIQTIARHHVENSCYLEAVRGAAIELNSYIKDQYKKYTLSEEDGNALMQRAFSPDKPIFTIADYSTKSGKSIQQGYMEIFCGVMKAMRNPVAHENMEITQTECLEQLVIFSHLLNVFERSEKPTM